MATESVLRRRNLQSPEAPCDNGAGEAPQKRPRREVVLPDRDADVAERDFQGSSKKRQREHEACGEEVEACRGRAAGFHERGRRQRLRLNASSYKSAVDVFDDLARKHPAGIAVVELQGLQGSLSWLELQQMSLQLARGLGHALSGLPRNGAGTAPVALLLRRSCKWLAATVAVMRCGRPFVWLSAGESAVPASKAARANEAKWWARNAAVVRLAQPCCIIANGQDAPAEAFPMGQIGQPVKPVLQFEDLLRPNGADAGAGPPWPSTVETEDLGPDAVLCYMFTGGSTGSPKCVKVSHAMSLHEVQRYPDVVSLSPADRVLQHTSVFWAASAWGQIDIALAFGSSICISLSATLSARELTDGGITVLGVSPSQLAALSPADLPHLRCIFSWGETLPPALAARWRSTGTVKLVELLISTEYWLSFYSDESTKEGGAVTFKAVSGVEFAVLPPESSEQLISGGTSDHKPVTAVGAVGELCIRGRTVMLGYSGSSGLDASEVFIDAAGGPYYHTRDTAVITRMATGGLGIEFRGRSDNLIKIGAEFVSLADIERRLEAHGLNVCVLPSSATGKGPTAHAFVAAATGAENHGMEDVSTLLRTVRAVLPHGVAMHLLADLPRVEITGKVDRQALADYVSKQNSGSEPLGAAATHCMLMNIARRYPKVWSILVISCCLDGIICVFLLRPLQWNSMCDCSVPNLCFMFAERLSMLPYAWLATVYMIPSRKGTDLFPFGRTGLVLSIMSIGTFWWRGDQSAAAAFDFTSLLSRSGGIVWLFLTIAGFVNALWTGGWRRCVSLPLVFWMAMPHHDEASWWCSFGAWRWWLCEALPSAPRTFRGAFNEAPQYELARSMLSRICCLRHSSVPANAISSKTRVPCDVGSEVQVWSMSQNVWLRGTIVGTNSSWLVVKYAHPDGQTYEKELPPDSECLQPVDPRSYLVVAFIFDIAMVMLKVLSAVAGVCSRCPPIPRLLQCFQADESSPEAEWQRWTAEVQQRDRAAAVAAASATLSDGFAKKTIYREYPLADWRYYERAWWDEVVVDFVNVKDDKMEVDVSHPDATAEAAPSHGSNGKNGCAQEAQRPPGMQAANPLEARIIALVEKHLDLTDLRMDSRLAGASSLSFMALCRSLRMELGCELQPDAAMACENVAELLHQAIAQRSQASAVAAPQTCEPVGGKYGVYFAPSQLKNVCAWIYHVDGLLDPDLFRIAASQLIERHEALRFALVEPPELVPFIQIPAGLHVALAPVARDFLRQRSWPRRRGLFAMVMSVVAFFFEMALKVLSFAFKANWPMVGPSPGSPKNQTVDPAQSWDHSKHDAHMKVVQCRRWDQVDRAVRLHKREYMPPFSIALLLMDHDPARAPSEPDYKPGDEAPRSYIHIVCTHAFSDGFSCFPLVSDLTELYESLVRQQRGEAKAVDLMPLPSAFAALQTRLFDALDLRPTDATPEQCTLRPSEFYLPVPKGVCEPTQYNHQVMFEDGAVAALRKCCAAFAVPLDVALFGAVAGALLRTGVCNEAGKLVGSSGYCAPSFAQLLTFALYAPMRDSASNEAMVGLFSDWRELAVAVGPPPLRSVGAENGEATGSSSGVDASAGITVLGLVLQFTGLIRSRQWRMFNAVQNSERILVNILALDERSHGALGMRQTRRHDYDEEKYRNQRKRSHRRGALRPMRLTLEQYETTSWWLSMDLSDDKFPPPWTRAFVCNLQRTVNDLVKRPLTPLL